MKKCNLFANPQLATNALKCSNSHKFTGQLPRCSECCKVQFESLIHFIKFAVIYPKIHLAKQPNTLINHPELIKRRGPMAFQLQLQIVHWCSNKYCKYWGGAERCKFVCIKKIINNEFLILIILICTALEITAEASLLQPCCIQHSGVFGVFSTHSAWRHLMHAGKEAVICRICYVSTLLLVIDVSYCLRQHDTVNRHSCPRQVWLLGVGRK